MKYAMLIDSTRCCLCYTCVVACKDEFVGNAYPPYSHPQPDRDQQWIKLVEVEKGKYPYPRVYPIPWMCMHCEKAPCLDACPVPGSIEKEENGVIIISPARCNPGICKSKPCMEACPYKVIFFNEVRDVCQKCTLCIHRLKQGQAPACVEACPAEVFLFGEASEIEAEIKKRGARVIYPERATEPRVFYIGLPSTSLAGHIIDSTSLMDVPEANVSIISHMGKTSLPCASDLSGNFLLENLTLDATYTLKIERRGYLPKTIENVRADEEYKHLGDVKLTRMA